MFFGSLLSVKQRTKSEEFVGIRRYSLNLYQQRKDRERGRERGKKESFRVLFCTLQSQNMTERRKRNGNEEGEGEREWKGRAENALVSWFMA